MLRAFVLRSETSLILHSPDITLTMASIWNHVEPTLDQLPSEMLFKIGEQLDAGSHLNLRTLNRRLYNVCRHFLRKTPNLTYSFNIVGDISEFIDLFADGTLTQSPTLTSFTFDADLFLELPSVEVVRFVTRFQTHMSFVRLNLYSESDGFLHKLGNKAREFNRAVAHLLSGVQQSVEELVLDNYMGLDRLIGNFPGLHTLRINCSKRYRRPGWHMEPCALDMVQYAPDLRHFHLNYTFHHRDSVTFLGTLLRNLGQVNPTCKCYLDLGLVSGTTNLTRCCEFLALEDVVCVTHLGVTFFALQLSVIQHLFQWIGKKTNCLKTLVLNPVAAAVVDWGPRPNLPYLNVLKNLHLPHGRTAVAVPTPTQDVLPALSKVTLGNLNWAPRGRLDSVTELTLENREGGVFGRSRLIQKRWLERVSVIFPNVRVLTVDESLLAFGEIFLLKKVESLKIRHSEDGFHVGHYWQMVASKKVLGCGLFGGNSESVRPLCDFQNLRRLELTVRDNTQLSKLSGLVFLSEVHKLKKLDKLVIHIGDKTTIGIRMTERIENLKKFHERVIIL